MRRLRLYALLMLVFSVAFTCEKDTDEEKEISNKREITVQNLVGTWEDYWYEGWRKDSANPDENLTWNEAVEDEDKTRYTFRGDNTGFLGKDEDDDFTWSLNGNKINLIIDGFSLTLTISDLTTDEFVLEGSGKHGTVEIYEKSRMRRVK